VNLVEVKQSIESLIVEKSFIDILSYDGYGCLMSLQKHEAIGFERTNYPRKSIQNRLLLLED